MDDELVDGKFCWLFEKPIFFFFTNYNELTIGFERKISSLRVIIVILVIREIVIRT